MIYDRNEYNMMKISFVIPCYNSENTIKSVISEIVTIMKIHQGFSYEIILISDNSPDKVFEVIEQEGKNDINIKGIRLAKNFGQHAALMAGYSQCNGDIIVSLDDDGQTPADEVFNLIDKLQDGYDVVYASYGDKKHSIFRNMGSLFNDLMAEYLISKPKNLKVSSFFVARKYIIEEMIKYNKPYPYLLGLVLRATNNVSNIQVNHRERELGKSGYTFKKLISLWLNGFTAFSVKPLRIATFIGFIFAFAGFLFGTYIIVNKIFNPQILAGYSSLMSAILLVGGMIMLMLGIIGEYIGRIYISINNAPQYVIRDTININESEKNR